MGPEEAVVGPLRGLPGAQSRRGLKAAMPVAKWVVAKWEAEVQYLPELPAAMEPRL